MGCHTWFYRPMTEKEFITMRESAEGDVEIYFGGICREFFNSTDLNWRDIMFESISKNKAVITDGPKAWAYWFQYGYGQDSIDPQNRDEWYLSDADSISAEFIYDKRANLFGAPFRGYVQLNMKDVARLRKTYPKVIIHNKRELRRYLRKDYFKITPEDHEKLSRFWKEFPGGIMMFG